MKRTHVGSTPLAGAFLFAMLLALTACGPEPPLAQGHTPIIEGAPVPGSIAQTPNEFSVQSSTPIIEQTTTAAKALPEQAAPQPWRAEDIRVGPERAVSGIDREPGVVAWAPDGSRAVFHVQGEPLVQIGQSGYITRRLYFLDPMSNEAMPWEDNGASPVWSPDGAWIYFLRTEAEEDGVRYDLYRRRIDGGERELLLSDLGLAKIAAYPSLAVQPDGKLVLLDAEHRPILFDPGTGEMISLAKQLELNDLHWQFFLSPDGQKLALIGYFIETGWRLQEFMVADLSTSEVLPIDVKPRHMASWSPDSSQLIFEDTSVKELWIMDWPSRERRRLLGFRDLGLSGESKWAALGVLGWSPDSNVAFVSAYEGIDTRDRPNDRANAGYHHFAVNLDGSHALLLSTPNELKSISPDGKWALFFWHSPDPQSTDVQLSVARLEKGNCVLLP